MWQGRLEYTIVKTLHWQLNKNGPLIKFFPNNDLYNANDNLYDICKAWTTVGRFMNFYSDFRFMDVSGL